MQKQQFELTLQRLKCFQRYSEFGAATNGIGAKRRLAAAFPELR
jgi:hypothetical protein